MNTYKRTIMYFTRKVKEDKTLSEEEWNYFAYANALYTAECIMHIENEINFENLKEKYINKKEDLFIYNVDLYNEIKDLQRQLDLNIEENGLNDEYTIYLSQYIDEKINEFNAIEKAFTVKNNQVFEDSYSELKELFCKKKRFLTTKEWNEYAKDKNLMTAKNLESICKLNWHALETKITREKNMKLYQKNNCKQLE